MPRKPRPKWPPLTDRPYGSGSLSRNQTTGVIRARLPTRISPTRQSREFRPHELADAVAWLDAHLRPAEATGSAGDTLGSWSGHWYTTFVQPVRSPGTARVTLWALAKLREHFKVPLDSVRTSQLQAVVNTISPTLTAPVLQAIVGVWTRCLQAAVDDRLIDRNPTNGLQLVTGAKTASTERRYITAAEIGILWPEIRAERFEAAFALVLGCGIRIGEILGLHWKHVDLDNGRAWIQHQFTEGVWRDLPKGHNPHWITLPPPVVEALRRHRASQAEGTVLVMQSAYGRLRKRDRDGSPWPWSRATVAADFTKLLDRLGIDPATPHSGRHGLATYWLDGGVPPAVVAERLGHANAGITMQFYARATTEGHERADELTAKLLGGQPQNGALGPDPGTLGGEVGGSSDGPIESDGDSV